MTQQPMNPNMMPVSANTSDILQTQIEKIKADIDMPSVGHYNPKMIDLISSE
jgi:hypothetical protein